MLLYRLAVEHSAALSHMECTWAGVFSMNKTEVWGSLFTEYCLTSCCGHYEINLIGWSACASEGCVVMTCLIPPQEGRVVVVSILLAGVAEEMLESLVAWRTSRTVASCMNGEWKAGRTQHETSKYSSQGKLTSPFIGWALKYCWSWDVKCGSCLGNLTWDVFFFWKPSEPLNQTMQKILDMDNFFKLLCSISAKKKKKEVSVQYSTVRPCNCKWHTVLRGDDIRSVKRPYTPTSVHWVSSAQLYHFVWGHP